jgi:glyoxylase-like metal-dependent hydrolase (beta-lactamase superfamily II)
MHVEADDPDGDWTRGGVFEVDPGVFRIPLPLPHDGLRAVNVYAVTDETGLVLIDSGWAIEAAREQLGKALAALDRDIRDVRRFLVTHIHRDHYGLAVALRREFGLRVSLGAGEQLAISRLSSEGHVAFESNVTTLQRCGAFELLAWTRERAAEIEHDPADWTPPDDWLDGSDVPLPERILRVVPTPGHTQGHVVFVDPAAGLLFAGDHVLPHITSSIGFEAADPELPLGDYIASLRLVRSQPDRRLLPAHGPVRDSVHHRVDELLDHHSRRLDEIHAVVGDRTLTAFEAAGMLTWTRRHKAFADLDQFNQMLAVGETGAHLDVLVAQGRLSVQEADRVRHYSAP